MRLKQTRNGQAVAPMYFRKPHDCVKRNVHVVVFVTQPSDFNMAYHVMDNEDFAEYSLSLLIIFLVLAGIILSCVSFRRYCCGVEGFGIQVERVKRDMLWIRGHRERSTTTLRTAIDTLRQSQMSVQEQRALDAQVRELRRQQITRALELLPPTPISHLPDSENNSTKRRRRAYVSERLTFVSYSATRGQMNNSEDKEQNRSARGNTSKEEEIPVVEPQGSNRDHEEATDTNTGPLVNPPQEKDSPVLSISPFPDVETGAESGCPICLEPLLEGELVNQGPCSHSFHKECLLDWLENQDVCPCCRVTMVT